MIREIVEQCVSLLKGIVEIPSFSREENNVADYIEEKLLEWNLTPQRSGNNIWIRNFYRDDQKPVILLNSHLDTVRPVSGWTFDPFKATCIEDRIFGLGVNDAGASVVSLLGAFLHFYKSPDLPFNLIFCVSAEEEVSGWNGISSILEKLGRIDLAIVGEPTKMQLAVAEKGLLVLDCEASGVSGHAARDEGENAIYKAIRDISILADYRFPLVSEILGPVKMTVTQIMAGFQHNVIPDSCKFVVDVRTNECYTNKEAYEIIRGLITSDIKARSFLRNSSGIDITHPVVNKGKSIGLTVFGSPTTSDQAVIPYPSVKIGPGDSARSHTANEYIHSEEIRGGIEKYIELLDGLIL